MPKGRLGKKLSYVALLVRRGGLGVLSRQLLSRACSASTYVWLGKDIDPRRLPGDAKPAFPLRPASPEDFRKLLSRLNEQKGQDVFEVLRRVSFFERGFDACYIVDTDSGDCCHFGWLLSARHNGLIRSEYPPGTDPLKEDEALVENIFTFPRYRGKGVMRSVLQQMEDMAGKMGCRRIVAYVDMTNTPSLTGFDRAGYKPYADEKEVRRFFKVKRTGRIGR